MSIAFMFTYTLHITFNKYLDHSVAQIGRVFGSSVGSSAHSGDLLVIALSPRDKVQNRSLRYRFLPADLEGQGRSRRCCCATRSFLANRRNRRMHLVDVANSTATSMQLCCIRPQQD